VDGQADKVVLVCMGVELPDIEMCKEGVVYAFRVGIPVVLVEFSATVIKVCFGYSIVPHHGTRGEDGGFSPLSFWMHCMCNLILPHQSCG
jgi:hypothetical protein